MANMRQGVLKYDADLDRFCLDEGGEITSVHCGNLVGIRLGNRYIGGRVEIDRKGEWYIIFPGESGKRDSVFTLRRRDYDARLG